MPPCYLDQMDDGSHYSFVAENTMGRVRNLPRYGLLKSVPIVAKSHYELC